MTEINEKQITISDMCDGFSIDIYDSTTMITKHFSFSDEDGTRESLINVFTAIGVKRKNIKFEEVY